MIVSGFEELVRESEAQQDTLWHHILRADANEKGITDEESLALMGHMWEAMKAASADYDGTRRSASGLSGGNGQKIREFGGNCVSGPFMAQVMAQAISMAESNACMRRIVAAPTAGSCGVLPAVLIPYSEQYQVPDQNVLEALYIAAGLGAVIAARASIAGAEGGCQAEIGAASGMAAAALTYLRGGSNRQIGDAAAMALKGLLGLVCDPVAGLVEIPCIKRNATATAIAFACAEMALAGVQSAIPADEVIVAMKRVGDSMPAALKETAEGGLAATPTAQALFEQVFGRAAQSAAPGGCAACRACR